MGLQKMSAKDLAQNACGVVSESEGLNTQALRFVEPYIQQLSSEALFGEAKAIVILHLGESYMLSITKQKKLLLTKVKHHLVR